MWSVQIYVIIWFEKFEITVEIRCQNYLILDFKTASWLEHHVVVIHYSKCLLLIRFKKMLVVETITCYCNNPCKIGISHTSKNPNREFYKCNLSSCDFFLWLDELRLCPCGGGPCKVRTSKVAASKGMRFRTCPESCVGEQQRVWFLRVDPWKGRKFFIKYPNSYSWYTSNSFNWIYRSSYGGDGIARVGSSFRILLWSFGETKPNEPIRSFWEGAFRELG